MCLLYKYNGHMDPVFMVELCFRGGFLHNTALYRGIIWRHTVPYNVFRKGHVEKSEFTVDCLENIASSYV